ncbi:MAG: acetate--CoA ligase family protein [Halobacteriaceae archaeon]
MTRSVGLDALFDPDRVAVVGASEERDSVGRALMENLAQFDGEVIPVNPNRERIFERSCYPSLSEAPKADLAIIAVPPDAAIDVVSEAGRTGIDTVVVITAGFSETGTDGAARESALREAAAAHDITLIGPNSLGVLSSRSGMNATFGPGDPLAGDVAFMSQSGAFVTAVLDWAVQERLGFRDVVSLGNKAVVDETGLVEAWGQDEETAVILGYLESIEDGRAFMQTASEVTRDTPIVLVKSGRTEAGARAASSHTGAIAGSERAYEAALAQAGVLRADSVQSLFDYARLLEGQPLPDSDQVAVVTNAGGPGVMATDAIGDSQLELASFTAETRTALSEVLPETANTHNPVDVIGDATVDRFRRALEVTLGDPGVGGGVVIAAPTATMDYAALGEAVATVQAAHELPVVAALMGGDRVAPGIQKLREADIPNYFDPARAVDSLDAASRYRDAAASGSQTIRRFDVDRERAAAVLEQVHDREGTRLGVEAMPLLEAYGLPIPSGGIADSPGEAEALATDLGDEVVMKIVSPDILHKSDIGGVRVGVAQAAVAETYEDLVARARNYQPDATVLGVQVQESLELDDATETILGMTRDPGFGPLILFGLGGVFVEILEDTAVRIAPVGDETARAMIDEVQAAPLLRGARGRTPADLAAISEAIQRLSQLAMDFPAILELDVNPLVAGPDGATAVDLRLTVDPSKL